MTIETGFDSNYRKVMVAARRARQLQNGSRALVPLSPPSPAASRRTRSTQAKYLRQADVPVVKPVVKVRAFPPGQLVFSGSSLPRMPRVASLAASGAAPAAAG